MSASTGAVQLFADKDYQGVSAALDAGAYDTGEPGTAKPGGPFLPPGVTYTPPEVAPLECDTVALRAGGVIAADTITSLKVADGYTVTLYSEPGFKGKSMTCLRDKPDLGFLDNKVASLAVYRTGRPSPIPDFDPMLGLDGERRKNATYALAMSRGSVGYGKSELDFKGEEGNHSRVHAVLMVNAQTAWAGTDATVSYKATCQYWESVKWFDENGDLAEKFKPVVTGTMTLSQDGEIIRQDDFRATADPSAPAVCTLDYTYMYLTHGPSYTVEIVGTKTGGRRTTDGAKYTGQDKVILQPQSVTFTS